MNKSNGEDGEMEMRREKEEKSKETGERERGRKEGESGGTAEVDTNEEPL